MIKERLKYVSQLVDLRHCQMSASLCETFVPAYTAGKVTWTRLRHGWEGLKKWYRSCTRVAQPVSQLRMSASLVLTLVFI
jgi:hypothetical protein